MKIFSALKAAYQSVGSRVALGLAAGGATLASVPIEQGATFDLAKFIPVVLAVSAWIGAELSSLKINADLHDLELRKLFRVLVRPSEEVLRSQDFGNSFNLSTFSGLFDVSAAWVGPEYVFLDKKVQAAFSSVLTKIVIFRDHIGQNAGPTATGGGTTFVPIYEDEWTLSESTKYNITFANDSASALIAEIDHFEELCVARLASLKEGDLRLAATNPSI